MKAKSFLKSFLIIVILLLFASLSFAQAGRGRGRISGVVEDEDGKVIQSAQVVVEFLRSEGIKKETTTNKKGEWAVLGLGTGMWRVTASADGYIPASTKVYVRQLQMNPKISLTLKKTEEHGKPIIKKEASLNLLEKANQLFSDEKYDEAIVLLEQFLEENPDAYYVHLSIGDCYREKGEFDKALERYKRSQEQAQKDELIGMETSAKALASIGEIYLRKEDFETAQKYFKQSIDTHPDNEILAFNVGEIYFSNRKIDEAIHYFELASQIKPDWAPSYLKLGYVYLNKGDNEKARLSFNKFLELDPESPEAPTVKNILEYLKK
ncbi:MAG: tetratricopeptide repeat protein [Candidatus Aminicenantaceae bacterium]